MSFNGGKIFEKCLISISSQNYPRKNIEIVVIDDKSEDNSLILAKKYADKIIISGKRDMYLSWAIGLHAVSGEYVYMLDQDIELKDENTLTKLVRPLIEDRRIVASFTKYYPNESQTLITRYISYHPFQCDPLLEFLSPKVEDSIVDKRNGYYLCKFELNKIIAESRMMYRMSFLKKTPNWKMKRIFDHDLLIKTIKSGYNMFAYVPEAGLYHYHAESLIHLVKKRVRNITSHYLPYFESLEYRWIDVRNKAQIFKVASWIVYANLFFPAAIKGFLRFLKYKDPALLMEPIVAITVTDVILVEFLKSKVGRTMFCNSFRTIFNTNLK